MYVQISLLQLYPMCSLYARHDQDLPRTLEAPVALDKVRAVRAQHTQDTDCAEEPWSASESHMVWSQETKVSVQNTENGKSTQSTGQNPTVGAVELGKGS